MHAPGLVLYLNGPSSAGKGTLARALQRGFDAPLLHIGIDLLFQAMYDAGHSHYGRPHDFPPHADRGIRWLVGDDGRLEEISFGPDGLRLVYGFHSMVAALSREGNNVVVDDVFFEPAMLEHAACVLHELPAYLIGVHCDLDELERREVARGDRLLGTARLLHEGPHRLVSRYDVEVDTTATSADDCARSIRQVTERTAPTAFSEIFGS